VKTVGKENDDEYTKQKGGKSLKNRKKGGGGKW
jgi:hypothetical protein